MGDNIGYNGIQKESHAMVQSVSIAKYCQKRLVTFQYETES